MYFLYNLKVALILIYISISIYCNSQTDSIIHKVAFNAIEFSVSNFVYNRPGLDLNFYKTNFIGDITLRESFDGFTSKPVFYEPSLFTQLHSPQIKAIFNLNNRRKYNLELQLGIKYRSSLVAGLGLYKSVIDTLAIIYNPTTGGNLLKIKETEKNHRLAIYCKELYIPISINYYTNKKNRLWLSLGIETALGIQFNYLYRNETLEQTYTDYTESGQEFSKGNANNKQIVKSFIIEQKIKGQNFVGYSSVPITLYFKLSKKQVPFKYLNAFINYTPGIYYSNSEITHKVISSFGYYSIGLRIM